MSGFDIFAWIVLIILIASAIAVFCIAGWLPGNGRTVTIKTADGYAVTLLHLGSIAVAADDGVAEGEAVGTIGPSGDAEVEVPYVHLGVRRADDPKGYLDPLTLLPARPAPERLRSSAGCNWTRRRRRRRLLPLLHRRLLLLLRRSFRRRLRLLLRRRPTFRG